ncbi:MULTISPECIES: helix-turn-helix domain-containing protein [Nocardia]|uniref:helix-turn-helix domain-containing protein n=1 Tax=Nocardia TaxID=1817 RepID=UPI00031E381C|nr:MULTISPECIES: helix-turn-helix domain-containing protein [Nocardia]
MRAEWTSREVKALREAALRLTQKQFAACLNYSVHTIRKWENIATPAVRGASATALDDALQHLDEHQRARFDSALDTGSLFSHFDPPPTHIVETNQGVAVDPGSVSQRHPSPDVGDDPVQRQQFLQLMTGAFAALAASTPAPAAATSRRLGVGDVERIRKRARALARQDHAFGGELSARDALAVLTRTTDTVHARFPSDGVRRDYLRALAELADTTAGVAFDAGLHTPAHHAFAWAVQCANAAGDLELHTKALTGLANLAVHRNRPDDALTYAEMALVRADLLPTRLRAIAHTRHARALGALGAHRGHDCLTAVHHAEDTFTVDDGRTPDWIAYYTPAHLHRDNGRALLYLSTHGAGDFQHAHTRLNDALAQFPAGYSRGKALAAANLATLVMARDDPHHAVTLGQHALQALDDIHSDRVNHALGQLHDACLRHPDIDDVQALRHQLDAALSTAV